MKRLKGFCALLGTAFIYGTFGIFVRYLSVSFSAYQQLAYRSLVAFSIIGILMLIQKRTFQSLRNVPKLFVFLHAITFPISSLLLTFALLQTKLAVAIVSYYGGSILASFIIGSIFFKEKLTIQKGIALMLGILAIFLFTYPNGLKGIDKGMILAFIAGTIDVITNSSKKVLGGKVDRFVLIICQLLACTLIPSIFLVASGSIITDISLNSWIWLIGFSLTLVFLSYFTLVGFQNFDLNLGTIILSSELFFAAIFGWIFFKEPLTMIKIFGCISIFAALCVMNITIPNTLKKVPLLKSSAP